MIKKIGVIQLIDSLNTGGAEILAVNIANSLADYGYNSHLCVTREEGDLYVNVNKHNYVYLNRQSVFDLKAIFKLKRYLNDNNICIIHAHSTSYFFAILLKMISMKIEIVWHNHYGNNINLKGFKFTTLKISTYFFKSIINVSQELYNWSKQKLFCKNNYYLKNFPLLKDIEKTTVLNGDNGKRILHLASFREEKDHLNLIKAFCEFNKKKPDWTLHLVGRVDENIYSKKVISLIKELGLKNHIFVYGSRSDIKNILEQSTIGVLSSKSEGLPLALLEYGLASLPVIVTKVGECAKVVENGKSGIVIEPQCQNELSNAILNLSNNEEKRNKFARINYFNIKSKYSESSFMKQLLKIYNL